MIDVLEQVEELKEKLVRTRRDFHKYAESGWLEYRTTSMIADRLTELGYEIFVGKDACKDHARMGVPHAEILKYHENRALNEGANPFWMEKMRGGFTGVVGVLKTRKPGPVIALRFDIDSNDLVESVEEKHRPFSEGFSSCHQGMMHACGHDGHASIGLGVAELLIGNIHHLTGEIRLLFQPAEEGCRGAKSMVEAGWLNDVDYFFGGHIAFKSHTLGEIVAAVGGFLATTKIDVEFFGCAAHAGEAPQNGKSALLAAAAATLHLHGINRHSGGATRVNVGTLQAGSGRNVIADHAHMRMETRGETTELNQYMTQEAIRIIENTAKVYGVDCRWEVMGEGPGALSSPELIPLIRQEAGKMKRVTSFVETIDLGGSEDVVYMINEVQKQGGKASYMLWGSPLKAGHHQVLFDFDEEVLLIAVEILSRLILSCQARGETS